MIIGCIGFILFFALLLCHRMHSNYLTGTSSTSNPTWETSSTLSIQLHSQADVTTMLLCASFPQGHPKRLQWWKSPRQKSNEEHKSKRLLLTLAIGSKYYSTVKHAVMLLLHVFFLTDFVFKRLLHPQIICINNLSYILSVCFRFCVSVTFLWNASLQVHIIIELWGKIILH